MKKRTIFIFTIFIGCFVFMDRSRAEDGFTQKDRELLIELKVKMVEIDKRFEQVDKRFEQVDKRFDQVDKRFDQVDKRFQELREDMNKRFEMADIRSVELREDMNKRFEMADIRSVELREDMNKRFEMVDKRFEQMFNFLWILTGIFTTLTVSVIGFAYWDRRTIIREAKRETIEEIERTGLSVKLLDVFRELARLDKNVASVLRQYHLL